MTRLPEPPLGCHWEVDVQRGQTMPTEVTVRLMTGIGMTRAKQSVQCGCFFDRPEDEAFFKQTVAELAEKCLTVVNNPSPQALRTHWVKEML